MPGLYRKQLRCYCRRRTKSWRGSENYREGITVSYNARPLVFWPLYQPARSKNRYKGDYQVVRRLLGGAAEQIKKTIEAIDVLKGLQASPNLSTEQKKLLGEVTKTFEGFIAKERHLQQQILNSVLYLADN